MCDWLIRLRGHLRDGEGYGHDEKVVAELDRLLGAGPWQVLIPCEVWTRQALAEIAAMPTETGQAWLALLAHCQAARSAKPSASWKKVAASLMQPIDPDDFRQRILAWFGLVRG